MNPKVAWSLAGIVLVGAGIVVYLQREKIIAYVVQTAEKEAVKAPFIKAGQMTKKATDATVNTAKKAGNIKKVKLPDLKVVG